MKIAGADYAVILGVEVGASTINHMKMTDEEIRSYQAARASCGLPQVSDKEALVEAQALVHFLTITYRD